MSTPTFEERYTAWIDGELTGEELAAFERELDARGRAEADRDRSDALRIGKLLRRHRAPEMPRAEAFNQELLRRLQSEGQPAAVPLNETPAPGTYRTRTKLAWAAAIALLVSVALLRGPHGDRSTTATIVPVPPARPAIAEIITAVTHDPDISVTEILAEKDGLAVLWLDGLDYLPESYQLQ